MSTINNGEKNNMSNNIKIWEIREGNVTSIKIDNIIFKVESKNDENIFDIVNDLNKKIKILNYEAITEPEKETKFQKIVEPEEETEPKEETEPENISVTLKPRLTKQEKTTRKYSKRPPQSRIQTMTPMLDKEGNQIKESGIPFFEEFKNIIFENFRAGEDITTQDVTEVFIEKFPDYTPSTLKNKAVAYMNWLYNNDKAELVKLDGVKRIYRLKKISMSENEIQDLQQRYQDDRKIFVGIL